MAGLAAHLSGSAAPIRAAAQRRTAALVIGSSLAAFSPAAFRRKRGAAHHQAAQRCLKHRSFPGLQISLLQALLPVSFAPVGSALASFGLASFAPAGFAPPRRFPPPAGPWNPPAAAANGRRLGQQHCPNIACQILATETSVRLSLNSPSGFFHCPKSYGMAVGASRGIVRTGIATPPLPIRPALVSASPGAGDSCMDNS